MIWETAIYLATLAFLGWVIFGGGAARLKGTFISAVLIEGMEQSPSLRFMKGLAWLAAVLATVLYLIRVT